MRIVIIGGTRFIGPFVARSLVAAGHEVTVFHRGQHANALPRGIHEIVSQDAAMPVRKIPDCVRARQPDVVLHMIAMGEEDTLASVDAFAGVAKRLIVPSSGDVYKAYGVLTRTEKGSTIASPLVEDSPLRTNLFPYRRDDTPPDALAYYYDKILVESAARSRNELPATILRLPKVYGPGDNQDLKTVYGFRNHPRWRWTHGFVANVAHAITLAITNERATGRTYNVGERHTPTIAERLADLPERPDAPLLNKNFNFDQDIVYDTARIRNELGFEELQSEEVAMRHCVEHFTRARM